MSPWEDVAPVRNSISLERFVRYKAFFKVLGRERSGLDVAHFLSKFQDWQQGCACDGERDARCLPLHVFSPSHEWQDLHVEGGVTEFEARHGRASSRVDEKRRDWRPPNALHGQEVLVVAGTALRSGFHWDVTSPRTEGRLYTNTEIWRFRRGAYCNVYPDAAVRQGQRNGIRAERVYEARRPDDTLARSQRSNKATKQRRHRR